MVCPRCKMAVEEVLKQMNFEIVSLELGRAVIENSLTELQKEQLKQKLLPLGFELLDDKKNKQIEMIKNAIINFLRYDEGSKEKLSVYLSKQINLDYNLISKMFSENEGITIEKYFILQKVERIKELLSYGELNLNEIADLLGYSSSAYLCSQFKSITGMTPSKYKAVKPNDRKSLDDIKL